MENLDLAIRKNRSAKAMVNLSHRGSPVAHQEIQVQQKNHKFLFGCNWGESTIALVNNELSGKEKEQAELRNERFLQLFNQVTLPFYWARFEPRRGQPQTQHILNVAQWYSDHHCIVKGHPLCWHTLTADWLLTMSNQEILQAQLFRSPPQRYPPWPCTSASYSSRRSTSTRIPATAMSKVDSNKSLR